MTEFLTIDGGQLAYDVTGEGPLIVLAHGMGDNRAAYRDTAARFVAAGWRVACVDQRGHGESSTGWASYTRTDAAADLLAVIRHLGGPAVIVGHSFAGGAATIAAAQSPNWSAPSWRSARSPARRRSARAPCCPTPATAKA